MSIQEIRKLFVQGFQKWRPNLSFMERWSNWRRAHQATAAFHHAKTRWNRLGIVNPLL
jgi:hypothetical protein